MDEVKIRVKRSIIPGREPGLLSLGELAINIPDKKIFIGNGTENILLSDFSDLGENLSESIRDLLNTTLVAGSNVNIDYEDTNNQIIISVPSESIQDAIGSILVAGTNIEIDYEDTNNQITINSFSEEWTNATSTTATDVVGIPAGSSLTGLTAIEILEQIVYPYQVATIPTFVMSGASTQYEIGATAGTPLFSWTLTNITNIASLTFSYTRTGDSGLPNGTTSPSIATPTTNYNPNLVGVTTNNIGAGLNFNLSATHTNALYPSVTSSTNTIRWWSKTYWGKSTNTNETLYSGLSGGSNSFVTSTGSYTFSVSATGSGYIYIFFEQSYDMSQILLGPTNVTSTFQEMASTQTIQNTHGLNVTYKVWRSVNQLGGSDTYTVTII